MHFKISASALANSCHNGLSVSVHCYLYFPRIWSFFQWVKWVSKESHKELCQTVTPQPDNFKLFCWSYNSDNIEIIILAEKHHI